MNDKVVLMTGGSSDFGVVTAHQIAKLSAKLAITSQKEENLREVARICEQTTGLKPLTILADVSIEREAHRVVNITMDHYGRLDVLVNNAGVRAPGGIKETPICLFDKLIKWNLRTAYCMTKAAIPALFESKGVIINIPSPPNTFNDQLEVVYKMTEVALNNFTKSIASELKDDRISVNSITPEFVHPGEVCDEEYKTMFAAYIRGGTANKLVTKAEEVAAMISHLASDQGRNITGASFVLGVKKAFKDAYF